MNKRTKRIIAGVIGAVLLPTLIFLGAMVPWLILTATVLSVGALVGVAIYEISTA